ncbi:MAG TPA: T9SS type A sorting domain-containing protein, partial [Bacteroidota bacterium]|nr:T9SS type A sorting domain-containing protein [Bacteroidota bacterium]
MFGIGSKADTTDPTIKSVANYKWHWRSMVSVMRGHPSNFFVIWTNAPLVAGETNPSQAAISDAFCRWAKDTLATGRDPVFGAFPKNVFVFDFFHLLAGADGMLPLSMALGSTDSHPNAAATTLVAPQLVKQVFDAALGYETLTGVVGPNTSVPTTAQLAQNYPNPFNPATVLSYQLPVASNVRLAVYDILGREVAVLVNERKASGSHEARFDATGLASGVYLYRLTAGAFVQTRSMILVK